MSRPPRERSRINPSVLLFPLAMGLIGWFVLSKTAPVPVLTGGSVGTGFPTTNAVSSTLVLLGRSRSDSDRDEKFIYDVNAQTLISTSTESGWRLPLKSKAYVTRRNEDGGWLLQGHNWSVSLRNARGRAYQDPLFIGDFDETHFAVAALDSDRRLILSVSKTGIIRELASLSPETVPLTVQDGHVWLVESAPREGIEMPPHGPSRVWPLSMLGTTTTGAVDERTDTLIVDVLASGPHVALISDHGDIGLFVDARLLPLLPPVAGKPLGWLPDGRLIFVQNGHICSLMYGSTPVCGPSAPDDIQFLSIAP